MLFETRECTNLDIVKELFVEYSHIKGAESCFVSFDKELNGSARGLFWWGDNSRI